MTGADLHSAATDFLAAPPSALPGLLRERIRPLLPERAFLRRARAGGLFVSNAPRLAPAEPVVRALLQIDLSCVCANGMLLLSPDKRMLSAFESAQLPSLCGVRESEWQPWDVLCRSLIRCAGRPPGNPAATLFAEGLGLLESAAAAERTIYLRRTRELAALCLRTGDGGALACAILARALAHINESHC